MRLAIVTASRLPHPDDDQPLLAAALKGHADVTLAAWDDEGIDWSRFDAAVIRSTWNYVHHIDQFLAWTRRAAHQTRLWNRAETIAWNADKQYLVDLAGRGVPVIPTRVVPRGSTHDLRELAGSWSRVVVKPRVSAGSFETHRFDVAALTGGELERCARERDVLVQPYVASVEDHGERSLVFIDGALSHAVRKSPRFSTDEESTIPVAVGEDERRCAEHVLSVVDDPLLYARVDLARDAHGSPQLMELELIEPSLFLRHAERSAERLANAILLAT